MRGWRSSVGNDPASVGTPTHSLGVDRWRAPRNTSIGRSSSVEVIYAAVVVAATVIAGLAAGLQPTLVAGGAAGLVLVGIILINVTAGLFLFLVIAFLESLPTVAGAPSIAKLVGLLLAIGWLGVVGFGRPGERSSVDFLSRNAALATALGLFLTWALFSELWAEDVATARETLFRYALNFVLFPIVFVAIRTPRHVVWFYTVFVVSALFVVVVGLRAAGGLNAGGARLEGGGLNPNQLGALLAVGAILATVLACYRPLEAATRVLALFAAAFCAVGVILTESRGALVGLTASLVLTPFLAGPGRRLTSACLVVAGGMAMTVWLILIAPHEALQRLTQAGGGTGRLDLWTIGLRMVHDRPLTGVGAGNFRVSAIHYLLEPGRITRPQYIIDQPKVTHNIYLQVLSELGFVGISLFGAAILICLITGLRAARAFRRQDDRDTELLVRGLLIALSGLLIADFFSSELYSKQLYILLALTPALFAMAHRQARQASPPEPRL
jgi:putative inorganic carbon (hco3(-)) transporter